MVTNSNLRYKPDLSVSKQTVKGFHSNIKIRSQSNLHSSAYAALKILNQLLDKGQPRDDINRAITRVKIVDAIQTILDHSNPTFLLPEESYSLSPNFRLRSKRRRSINRNEDISNLISGRKKVLVGRKEIIS
jgi:hypothetical protein